MAESISPHRESPPFEEAPFLSRKYDEDRNIKQILTRHDTLLSYLQAQRDTDASRQLELLQAIKDELVSQATPLHFISNAIVQIIFVAFALTFGIFTVYGVWIQVDANYLSRIQNQINIVTFCQANNLVGIPLSTSRKSMLTFLLDNVRDPLQ
jgi:hypothetical protein